MNRKQASEHCGVNCLPSDHDVREPVGQAVPQGDPGRPGHGGGAVLGQDVRQACLRRLTGPRSGHGGGGRPWARCTSSMSSPSDRS